MTKPFVSIIGLNGSLGKALIEALTIRFRDEFQFPIHAVTRDASNAQDSDLVKYFTASVDDEKTLTEAFKGTDVVYDLVGMYGSHDAIVSAAANAGVQVYFPSEYGVDYAKSDYAPLLAGKKHTVDLARAKGLKTVELKVGHFFDWLLQYLYFGWIDEEKGEFNKFSDGPVYITGVFVVDIVNTLAILGSKPSSDLKDVVKIYGANYTPDEVAELYEKVKGKTLKIKDITKQSVRDNLDNIVKAGTFTRNNLIDLLHGIIAEQKAGNFKDDNDNEYVNPGEKYFKWKTDWRSYAAEIWKD